MKSNVVLAVIFLASCSSVTRMTPKDPLAFDYEHHCDDKAMHFPELADAAWMNAGQAHGIAKARGRCAEAAIANADENRTAAQYNKTAAEHNGPDTFGERFKIFTQGFLLGLGTLGLAVATGGGSLAPVLVKCAVAVFL